MSQHIPQVTDLLQVLLDSVFEHDGELGSGLQEGEAELRKTVHHSPEDQINDVGAVLEGVIRAHLGKNFWKESEW